MQLPLPEKKPAQAMLYSKKHPKGKLFDMQDAIERKEELIEQGFTDSPANLDLPEEVKPAVTKEKFETMSPESMVSAVKELGYLVYTPVELEAEIAKALTSALNIADEPEKPVIFEDLMDKFREDPKSLNKEELIVLGNKGFKLGLRSNMNEQTLITKVEEAINAQE